MALRSLLGPALFAMAAGLAIPAHAADPTMNQIYTEARSGDVDGALTQMTQVLKDHPNSGKAHYVEAELLAHAHRLDEARGELAKAESINPALTGISPHSVGELKAQLNGTRTGTYAPTALPQSHIPWGMILVLGIVVFGFLAMMRRRAPTNYAPGAGMNGQVPPQGGMMGPGYGGGMMGGGMMGGGMMGGGGGLLGGLARGAAMGAGFAAGERVIDDVFGGGGNSGAGGFGGGGVDPNQDMGGSDFGVSDSGGWDGGGGGDSGGGW